MCIDNSRQNLALCVLALPVLLCFFPAADADPIDEADDVPATAAELRFIESLVNQFKTSVPEIEGWTRDVTVSASGNTVKEGEHPRTDERARDYPLKISVALTFREITAADRHKEGVEKSAQQLQEELMAAAMRGDMQEVERLNQELAALVQAEMIAGPMGQAAGITPMMPEVKAAEFSVRVIVNGEGETIGKRHEVAVQGVAKAFGGEGDDFLSYRYYMGGWDISEFDPVNWSIRERADHQTAANHLKALVLTTEIRGDKEPVRDYVENHLDLEGISDVLD